MENDKWKIGMTILYAATLRCYLSFAISHLSVVSCQIVRLSVVSLVIHIGYLSSFQSFQKTLRLFPIELRVRGFNAQKETVPGRKREAGHIENRMIGQGQTIEGQHSQNGRQCRYQHRGFKCDGNERGPTMQG